MAYPGNVAASVLASPAKVVCKRLGGEAFSDSTSFTDDGTNAALVSCIEVGKDGSGNKVDKFNDGEDYNSKASADAGIRKCLREPRVTDILQGQRPLQSMSCLFLQGSSICAGVAYCCHAKC